jgi:hypothetical protein
MEAARVLAQRLLLEPGGDEDRLKRVFERVTHRAASTAELSLLHSRLEDLRGKSAASARELLEVGEARLSVKAPAGEQAAWAGLCLMLLNLDEVLCKE